MNKKENDILQAIKCKDKINQRDLAEITGYSLGTVNSIVKNLYKNDYIDKDMNLTKKAKNYIKEKSPKNAIILAAGYGMRMVPINLERPKGLIEINGEPLIERIIKQLTQVNIEEIYIVVGFMKEAYEYLIEEYGVKLIESKDYAYKNNLHSLKYALDYLSNTYVIPCDVWSENNPFNQMELYPWYMVTSELDENSIVRLNKKSELVLEHEIGKGNKMIGIAYLDIDTSSFVKKNISFMCKDKKYNNIFWEEALFKNDKMLLYAKQVQDEKVVEINTYEQLRELDDRLKNLQNEAITIASNVFDVKPSEITDITVLKKGMTNRSFLFMCKDKKYIMRIPGQGTDKLINRKEEADVYEKLKNTDICDNIVYINSENGYKITEFFDDARVCNPFNNEDVKKCVNKLRKIHERNIKVDHEFDVFKQIDLYEKLCNGEPSIYRDYERTKENVVSLKSFIDSSVGEKVLTHIDAVPDNFLFIKDKEEKEDIRLIDWEYAGMQDPHVDIAMFGIYALYNKEQIDKLIDYYFCNKCEQIVRIKIYSYISACGLLWSNWCEYKRNLGIEFGEYSLQQYRYAKEYYRIVKEELEKLGDYEFVQS